MSRTARRHIPNGWLAIVLLMLLLAACGSQRAIPTEDAMARGYVLPRLEIPERALLLYEHMVMKDPDRTGNWRFVIDDRGCLYNARNTQLWLLETEQFESDDPALTWSTPFPSLPDRCLTESQMVELGDSIRSAGFPVLKPYYVSASFERISSPTVERWTLVQEKDTYTISVEQGAVPLQLTELAATVNRLIAAAPRPTSP